MTSCWEEPLSIDYLWSILLILICIETRITKLQLPLCVRGDLFLLYLLEPKFPRHQGFLDGLRQLDLLIRGIFGNGNWSLGADPIVSLRVQLPSTSQLNHLNVIQDCRIQGMLENATLPWLRYIRFDANPKVYLDIRHLPSFLRRHHSTLKGVRLNLEMCEEVWRDVLATLREECDLALCDFRLHDATSDAIAYVLHRGPWSRTLVERLGSLPEVPSA